MVLSCQQIYCQSEWPPGLLEREALTHSGAHTFPQILEPSEQLSHPHEQRREPRTRTTTPVRGFLSAEAACLLCNGHWPVTDGGLLERLYCFFTFRITHKTHTHRFTTKPVHLRIKASKKLKHHILFKLKFVNIVLFTAGFRTLFMSQIIDTGITSGKNGFWCWWSIMWFPTTNETVFCCSTAREILQKQFTLLLHHFKYELYQVPVSPVN